MSDRGSNSDDMSGSGGTNSSTAMLCANVRGREASSATSGITLHEAGIEPDKNDNFVAMIAVSTTPSGSNLLRYNLPLCTNPRYLSTSTASNKQIILALVAVSIAEVSMLHQTDVGNEFLQVGVEERIYIELPKDCRDSPDSEELQLQKDMCDLLYAGLVPFWLKNLSRELKLKRFEKVQTDPGMFYEGGRRSGYVGVCRAAY